MTDFNFNDLQDRFQVLDSYIQLISGSDRYRFKSAQAFDPIFDYPQLVRINDEGLIYFNRQVVPNRVTLDLRLTADLVDTADPPTNVRTVSYYIYQKHLGNSVQIQVSNVYYAKDASSNKYGRLNFTFELDQISMPRRLEAGDIGLGLTGVISNTTRPTFIRSAS